MSLPPHLESSCRDLVEPVREVGDVLEVLVESEVGQVVPLGGQKLRKVLLEIDL